MTRGPHLAVLVVIALPSIAHAQPTDVASPLRPSAGAMVWIAPHDDFAKPVAARAGVTPALTPGERPAPWWAPLASAAVPGAGQGALRQWRALGYVAIETLGWVQHLRSDDEGRRERGEYQKLARVARAPFSATLPNGNQAYYERMLHHLESGAFDLVPGGQLDPELDAATYNGSVWELARRTYWEDPDQPPPRESPAYRSAEDFYLARAIRPEFRWSWTSALDEREQFRRAVVRSNEAFRDAGFYLGAILVNHALSAVDAFATVRLRRDPEGARTFGLEGSIPWAPFGRPSSLRSGGR